MGTAGSIVIAVSSLAAGALPVHDPLASLPGMDAWRSHPLFSVIPAYAGLAVLVMAWLRLGEAVGRSEVSERDLWLTLASWGAPFLLIPPLYSRDVYSYLAQGFMFGSDLDPYRVGPAALGGELAANVSPIWQYTTAPYGPAFLAIASAVMAVAGGVVLGILLLRLVAIGSVVAIGWVVRGLARRSGVDPVRALWLGVLNPLMVCNVIAGVHNDGIMIALLLGALLSAGRRRGTVAGVLIGVAALVKAPALIAIPFVAGRSARPWRTTTVVAATTVGVMALITSAMGTWYGWVGAIGGTVRVHNGLSVITDVGDALAHLNSWLGFTLVPSPVTVMRAVGAAAAIVVLVMLTLRLRDRPVLAVGLGLGAVLVFGPIVHPWYLLWAIVPLAASTDDRRLVRAMALLSAALAFFSSPSGASVPGQTLAGLAAAATTWVVLWPLTASRGTPTRIDSTEGPVRPDVEAEVAA
jgi:hypothetical protein